MLVTATCLLLLAAHSPQAPTVEAGGRVEVCSPALGDTCQSFAAADLDPTRRAAARGGQVAFVDPESGQPIAPTAAQIEDFANTVSFSEKVLGDGVEPELATLPSGAVRLHYPGGFRTLLSIRIEEPKP